MAFAPAGRVGLIMRRPAFEFVVRLRLAFVLVAVFEFRFALWLTGRFEFPAFALRAFVFCSPPFEFRLVFVLAAAFEFELPFEFLFVGLRRFAFVFLFSSSPSVPRSVLLSAATVSSTGCSPSFGARLTTTATVCPPLMTSPACGDWSRMTPGGTFCL